MRKFHYSTCIDRLVAHDNLLNLANSALDCESGEVLELNFDDVTVHIVIVDSKEENFDD